MSDSINTMDLEKIQEGVRLILEGIGEDPGREGLVDTPSRVARAMEEMCQGLHQDAAPLFDVSFDADCHDMVIVRDIPFYSLCEHHLLPFFGHAHIAYIPSKQGRVCGISKLARCVEVFARRPQLQERLTSQIASAVQKGVDADGVMVVVEAQHLCMTMRGVKKPGSQTVTSAVRGCFKTSDKTRMEAMQLLLGQ